jgi:mono/diheme cytochrome c family protein
MKVNLTILIVLTVVVTVAVSALNFYDDIFPYGRMWETPAVRPHEEPLPIMEAGVVPFGGGEAILRSAAPESLKLPFNQKNPTQLAAGKTVYAQYCVHCHGRNYDGMGTVGQSFAPLPGDLRSAKVQNLHVGQLFKEISYGIPDGRQPALASTIEITDRWRVIAYVKSLGVRP